MKFYNITVNGKTYGVSVNEAPKAAAVPAQAAVNSPAATPAVTAAVPAPAAKPAPSGAAVTSPINGKVLSLKVKSGDKVNGGDILLILADTDAATEILAPVSGTISKVLIAEGSSVSTGDSLIEF